MELTEIKQRLTLATVLHYYGLKPDKNMRLHCPFHEDKTPSLYIPMKVSHHSDESEPPDKWRTYN